MHLFRYSNVNSHLVGIYFVLIYWIRTVFGESEQQSWLNQDRIFLALLDIDTLLHKSKQCQSFRFSSICKQTLEKYGNYVPFSVYLLLYNNSKDTNDQCGKYVLWRVECQTIVCHLLRCRCRFNSIDFFFSFNMQREEIYWHK